jgi:hypothetical protein
MLVSTKINSRHGLLVGGATCNSTIRRLFEYVTGIFSCRNTGTLYQVKVSSASRWESGSAIDKVVLRFTFFRSCKWVQVGTSGKLKIQVQLQVNLIALLLIQGFNVI